ncbi:MAG: hypothetical protein ACJAQT_001475 [Akkermansiaceae bacterium]|jgi:hypothetical protein
MKSPFLSLTNGGIIVILLGLIVAGLSSHLSGKNDEFLEHGLLRAGRIVSAHPPKNQLENSPKYALRIMTNVSPDVSGIDMQIIEVGVKDGEFKKASVGSQLKLIIIPGAPPRARLAGSTKNTSYRVGYVIASLFICLGLLIFWLAWRNHKTPQSLLPQKPKWMNKAPTPAAPSNTMEKQTLKDDILYEGPFEFSYSAEKTNVELKDGTTVHVSQYRPLSDLPKVLADRDILHVLRTAQSPWKLVNTIKTGHLALSHLLKEKHATSADQFFINGPHLGLLFRDEVDNGQWRSIVRGLWKITPLSHTYAKLVSGNPDLARQASFEILNHADLELIATLAPNLPIIRAALKVTPRTGEFTDDRRFITRAADIIESLSKGNCYCQVYAKTSDPPHVLIEKGRFTSADSEKLDDKRIQVTCSKCALQYKVTEHPGRYLPYYVWELKK